MFEYQVTIPDTASRPPNHRLEEADAMKPFHYAILRYQHSITVGELVNVGVVVLSLADNLFRFRLNHRFGRLSNLYPGFDGRGYRRIVDIIGRKWKSVEERLASGQEDFTMPKPTTIHELQKLLLPSEEHVFVWSEPMGGLTDNLETRLDELMKEFVTGFEPS